jgi:hypothetical protein
MQARRKQLEEEFNQAKQVGNASGLRRMSSGHPEGTMDCASFLHVRNMGGLLN